MLDKHFTTEIIPSAGICVLENAIVVPMLPGSNPGRVIGGIQHPVKPNFAGQYRGTAVNIENEHLELASDENILERYLNFDKKLQGTYLYCGPAFNNFGHFLAECIHRAWAYEYFTSVNDQVINKVLILPQVPAKFSWLRRFRFKLPSIFLQTLVYLGIPEEKVKYQFTTTKVANLVVPEQASFFRASRPVDDAYLAFLKRCELRSKITGNKQNIKKIYVSRIHFKFRGAYAGESYLEHFFVSQGYKIFYPQNYSLLEQLDIYKSATDIVFAEGGALHILELLSDISARVTVIGRRPKCAVAFTSILQPRVQLFHFFTDVITLPSLFVPKRSDRTAHGSAISMLNSDLLVTFLSHVLNMDTLQFDQDEFRKISEQDIQAYRSHYQKLQPGNQQTKQKALDSFNKQFEKLFPI